MPTRRDLAALGNESGRNLRPAEVDGDYGQMALVMAAEDVPTARASPDADLCRRQRSGKRIRV